MSAYITLLTPMIDRECLLAALVDMGFGAQGAEGDLKPQMSNEGFGATKVEVHDTPVSLVGYRDDLRQQTANIVIRKKYVGPSSNDVGFLATNTGYQLIVSGYDQGRFGKPWLSNLHARYQVHSAAKQERAAAAEKRRIEEERKKLVEAQRQAVYERAKKMGYSVKESREADKIRLVLVQRTY
jgi:uncharacterized protein (UPF0335 family)